MKYDIRHDTSAHRFNTTLDGYTGYVEYAILADDTLDIRHTIVPGAIEGRGVAAALTEALLEYARANGLKVLPSCSYAKAYLMRHPQYADLLPAGA